MQVVRRHAAVAVAAVLVTGGLALASSTAADAAVPRCFGKPATIVGTSGTDYLEGTPGDDVIVGLGGTDNISVSAGDDLICAGTGPDDFLSLATAPRGLTVDLAAGTVRGWGPDRISGFASVYDGPYDDVLKGDDGPNVFMGGRGDDRIHGRGGDDMVSSRPGQGQDRVSGDAGADTIYLKSGSVGDGGTGEDTVYVAKAATGRGGAGDDYFVVLGSATAGPVPATAIGDAGRDAIGFLGSHGGMRIDVQSGVAAVDRGSVRFVGMWWVMGTRHADVILGSDRDEWLFGSNGRDRLVGRGGADHLVGNSGRDRVDGGVGDDACLAEVRDRCEATSDLWPPGF